ncbi:MAG: branched-chain amino acid ABC transporter permease [Bacteroidales bacterium]|nr:branched-chain amino acid ABC transporter permease [Bacteroidales bacterium]
MNYVFHILIMINIYIILSVSTNLLVGMANLLSLGQAAFYGIGAYVTAYALIGLGLPLLPTLLLAMGVTAIFSFLLAYISLKLEGDYFILATLGFQIIIFTILYNWIDVTRGPYGIPGIPSPKLFGLVKIEGITGYIILSTILSAITIFVFYKIINSPFGRALKGMRDDEIAMISLGKNITVLKVEAFVLSSAFVAIAGFIYASYISYIDPTSFNLDEAIFILTAILIGGTGNIKGPVIGAVFVVLLPEILRFVGMPDNLAANMRMIIYGLTLIILMRYRPQGIAGEYKFSK